jgi:hypothetical protein
MVDSKRRANLGWNLPLRHLPAIYRPKPDLASRNALTCHPMALTTNCLALNKLP